MAGARTARCLDAACRPVAVLIRTVRETGSTNADLLALAATGRVKEGDWLRAERQASGRGRLGRAWASPDGNLFASTAVHVRSDDPAAATLALVSAVALEEAVRVVLPDQPLRLKWPNDLLVDGAKLSGVLLERVGNTVVVGIGVNVVHAPTIRDRSVCALHALGSPVSAGALLDIVAESFARWLGSWRRDGLLPVRNRWLARAHPIGTALTVRLPGGATWDGLFDGLAEDGALLLRLADGERRVIHAADVFLL